MDNHVLIEATIKFIDRNSKVFQDDLNVAVLLIQSTLDGVEMLPQCSRLILAVVLFVKRMDELLTVAKFEGYLSSISISIIHYIYGRHMSCTNHRIALI